MREKLRSQRESVISLPKSWDSRRNRETRQVCKYDINTKKCIHGSSWLGGRWERIKGQPCNTNIIIITFRGKIENLPPSSAHEQRLELFFSNFSNMVMNMQILEHVQHEV